jgi:hypothetical protein
MNGRMSFSISSRVISSLVAQLRLRNNPQIPLLSVFMPSDTAHCCRANHPPVTPDFRALCKISLTGFGRNRSMPVHRFRRAKPLFVSTLHGHIFRLREIPCGSPKSEFVLPMPDGSYAEIAAPINAEARSMVEEAVFAKFEKVTGEHTAR